MARQLADSLAMPILIVDTEETLIYYNESAEGILGQHFDETGEMVADEWTSLFAVADEARRPIDKKVRPLMMALSERKPHSRTLWLRGAKHEWQHVNITALPLMGDGGQFFGAMMIFWKI